MKRWDRFFAVEVASVAGVLGVAAYFAVLGDTVDASRLGFGAVGLILGYASVHMHYNQKRRP